MACTALSIQAGLFINTTSWSQAPNTSMGGRSVTISSPGGNPTITVTGPTGSNFITLPSGSSLHYKFFGTDNHLAVWTTLGGAIGDRHVSIVDFGQTPPAFVDLVFVSVPPATGAPACDFSQGNGAACLIWAPNSSGEVTSLGIYNSNTGASLCPGPPPFTPTGQTAGEATTTDLIIHFSSGGTSKTATCPLPLGHCKITPTSLSFADVVVGGCPVTPPTKTFTIKNDGTDCLQVTAITNAAGPFSLSPAPTLPLQLSPTQSATITVKFAPAATGNFSNSLSVTTVPANGDNAVACTGKGASPVAKLSFSSNPLDFGKQPVGSNNVRTLTITNSGTAPVTLSAPGGLGVFSWPALASTTLTCTGPASSTTITATFVPSVEGPASATLTVNSNAVGSPHMITLEGEGCVPNALIDVPPTAPIGFGQIEQGFRTVRFFTVKNPSPGDGTLTFDAAISGVDAALFGLQPPSGSVTDVLPARSYVVDPISPCGMITAGSGETSVAVAFWANATPKMCAATLTLSNSNATNFPASKTWVFPLTAEITPPAAIDAGLVIDRSGSMSDPLGAGAKIDQAVAAAQLFTQLLRPDMDDRTSVVRFNEKPEVVQPMVYVSSNTTSADHEKQSVMVANIAANVPPPAGFTAIGAGALVSFGEIAKPRTTVPAVLRRACVLLTDGMDNTGYQNPVDSQWYSLNGGMKWDPAHPGDDSHNLSTQAITIPAGVKLHAVGIAAAGQGNFPALQQATQSSGGFFALADNLSGPLFYQLEKFYVQVFMDIVGMASITDPAYTIFPGQKHEIEFEVLRGDVSALVVLFDYEGMRLPFSLLSPKGEVLDVTAIPAGFQARWGSTNTARFFEFRMPQSQPSRFEGTWKVLVWHDGRVCFGPIDPREAAYGFLPRKCRPSKTPVQYGISIAVGSNFRMLPFATPGPLTVGDPILLSALVNEAGVPILGCNVVVTPTSPSGFVWPALTLFDDGSHQDGATDDGEYANTFAHTIEVGVYSFAYHATGYSRDGKPMVREATLSRYVAGKNGGGGQDGGAGSDGDCCNKLLRAIEAQSKVIARLAKAKG